jgi:hypothetical protein
MQHETRVVNAEKGIVQVTTEDERFYSKRVDDKIVWIPSVTWIADFLPKGIGFYKWLANTGWDESQSLKEAGGERGTMVHNAIETLLRGNTIKYNTIINDRELTTEEYYGVMSFKKWFDTYKPIVERFETTVFSPDDRYAGTLDLQCIINEDRYIVDFKTSSSIWPSHIIQVSAYKHACGVEIKNLAILQLGYKRNKNGYKFTEIPDKFDLFNAAYKIWADEMSNVSPLQRDYPLEISLNINQEEAI